MSTDDAFEEMLARFRSKRGDAPAAPPVAHVAPSPAPPETHPPASPAAPPAPDPPPAQPSNLILSLLPVASLRIDPGQPRRYLPADLRRGFASGALTAEAVLQQLSGRAGAGDAEAAGYLGGISELAASLDDVGLRQPIEVRALPGEPPAYQIVDGERRFWAYAFARARRGEPLDGARLPALVQTAGEEVETAARAQWIVNDQREGVPVMTFADTVARIYRGVYDRAVNRRRETCEAFGRPYDDTTDARALAMELAVTAVARETGRTLTANSLYRYLQAAEGIAPPAKALAAAYGLSLRSLTRLAQIKSADEQLRLARKLTAPSAPPAPEAEPSPASKPGRRTAVQRHVMLLCELEALAANEDKLLKSLRKADRAEQDEYLHMLHAQRQWIDRLLALATRALGRAPDRAPAREER